MRYSKIHKIKNTWRKNSPDIKGLCCFSFPSFVTRNILQLENEIPVFTFHSIEKEPFEEQLHFLASNGYTTITADTLIEMITGQKKIPPKTVMLTFDDGHKSLYTTAFPLLKKYSMKAVAFICPGLLESSPAIPSLINWQDAVVMHKENIMDFQSHSMYHDMVFTNSNLINFIHPGSILTFEGSDIPLYRHPLDQKIALNTSHLGFPLFPATMRLAGKPQYIISQDLIAACLDFVRDNGGKTFYAQKDWYEKLSEHYKYFIRQHGRPALENEEETKSHLIDDLKQSKSLIEKHLLKEVRHIAFPLYQRIREHRELLEQTGYKSSYHGVILGKRTNKRDKKTHTIVRLSDFYLFRLPGTNRKSLATVLKNHYNKHKNSLFISKKRSYEQI